MPINNKERPLANLYWINPANIRFVTFPQLHYFLNRHNSCQVYGGSWDEDIFPLEIHSKAIYCRQRWQEGHPWSKTMAFHFYNRKLQFSKTYDKCRNLEDVENRLESLDSIFLKIQKMKCVSTRYALGLTSYREDESGGIYVHFDRNFNPIFSGGGFHRLMIAKILRLHVIPVQVGVIHEDVRKKLGTLGIKKLLIENRDRHSS